MRALMLKPGGRLDWAAAPAPPPPGPLGAVVHPIAIATCDMDRPMALGATPFVAPLSFGHECVAEVLSVGADVAHVRPGQRVVVPFQINCGECAPCRAGHTANCLSVPPASMYGFGVSGGHWGGAVADELAVPFADAMLVPFPSELDPVAAASVADNVSDAYRHIGPHLPALLERDPGTRVLIAGAVSRRHLFTASVPLYAGLIAQALGATDVVLADARPGVRREAEALGLPALTPKEASRRGSAPLVADVTATPEGLRFALGLTASDGVCSSSGSLHAHARIPTLLMYGRNVTLTVARAHARALIPEVLALMETGRLRPERVTTAVAPFDDAAFALTDHMRGASTKTIITAG
jgi:alcohol dehydrogenase